MVVPHDEKNSSRHQMDVFDIKINVESLIDVNVYLSQWPFRRLPSDETAKLVERLRARGVTQAWAGSFEALLHKDIEGVNARLAAECKEHGDALLIGWGAVNPMLPDWKEDLRRCVERHQFPGVRLHPNYHGYKLDDPVFAELLDLCEQAGLIVQIAVRMEDTRTQHPLVQVNDVDVSPLAKLLKTRPKSRVVLLNSLRTLRPDAADQLLTTGRVWLEISMLEGVAGIEQLLKTAPLDRLLFGSYFPFFYLESAMLKLRESQLGKFQIEAITFKNAEELLPKNQQ